MYVPCVMTITHGAICFFVHCVSIRMFFTCHSCSLHGDIRRGFCGSAFNSFWFRFIFLIFVRAVVWSSSSLTVRSTRRPRCHPPASFAVSTLSFIMIPVHILWTSSVFASKFSQFAPWSLGIFFRAQPSQLRCFSLFGRFFHALWCRASLQFFPGMVMTHLWSLPMWIMSLASVSLLYLKYILLANM